MLLFFSNLSQAIFVSSSLSSYCFTSYSDSSSFSFWRFIFAAGMRTTLFSQRRVVGTVKDRTRKRPVAKVVVSDKKRPLVIATPPGINVTRKIKK
ncbi:hypothetical protein V6N11_054728 [Hibiscus sabdariffa]|uniref:Uncharacterized protein n=1 Tax=Hibiscus sabdariffa TaxID=183260 RepID=A0ABR2S4Q7_9ROSI